MTGRADDIDLLALAPADWHARAETGGAWILPDAVFDGRTLRPGAAILVRDGRLQVHDRQDADGCIWRLAGTLSPGFVDLQVNGGGGVLFNAQPTEAGARAIGRAHRTTGTAAVLPTLITDRPEVMERAADAALAAIGKDGVAGLHLEGPHFSLARRGTHAAEHIRPLDDRTMALAARLRARGMPLMLTVAPEATVPGQIGRLVGQGVIVALGHSDADGARVRAALAEGAQTFTHLFNAMSQMQGREPGMVGTAINSQAYVSVIADGIHVAPEMLALAIRARPIADRMIVVTDAMPTVAGTDHFELYGQTIRLNAGRLVNSDGALAGAHVTMIESVAHLIHAAGLAPGDALAMATSHPARLMGLDALAMLEGRDVTDLLWISPDWRTCRFLLT